MPIHRMTKDVFIVVWGLNAKEEKKMKAAAETGSVDSKTARKKSLAK